MRQTFSFYRLLRGRWGGVFSAPQVCRDTFEAAKNPDLLPKKAKIFSEQVCVSGTSISRQGLTS